MVRSPLQSVANGLRRLPGHTDRKPLINHNDSVEAMNHFVKEEEGATAVEYALMAGLIAAVIASAVIPIGVTLSSIFTSVLPGLGS